MSVTLTRAQERVVADVVGVLARRLRDTDEGSAEAEHLNSMIHGVGAVMIGFGMDNADWLAFVEGVGQGLDAAEAPRG